MRTGIVRHTFVALLCCATALLLKAEPNPTDAWITEAETHLRMFPQDPGGYAQLGAGYLQKGRETGDASYYELAKKSLQKSLDLYGSDMRAAPAATYMAVVMMAEHRFQDALDWSQRAVAFGLGDASPWAITGDAYADLGEYSKAEEAYGKLAPAANQQALEGEVSSRPLMYEHHSRVSFLRFVHGDPTSAIRLMQAAIAEAEAQHRPAENISWSYFQLGDLFFQVGQLGRAEEAYQQSLAISPEYYRGLAGVAKVRAAQSRLSESAELYERSLRVIPVAEYAANLGDVYAKLGRMDEAKKSYDLVEFTAHLSSLNQSLNNRELAQYYADHDLKLSDALTFARKELEIRRDVYTWDVLAWALYKNDKLDEAASAISHAVGLGTKDALFFYHAGMIYSRLGDAAKAREYLDLALATNPHFHIFYADTARKTLARLEGVSVEASAK